MNFFTSLLSSILLSFGFSRLAARFDQWENATTGDLSARQDRSSAGNCTYPCRWQQS